LGLFVANSQDAEDKRKQEIARQLLLQHSNIIISTQVLNELSNVWLRKYQFELEKVKLYLQRICEISEVRLLDDSLTFEALDLLKNYNFSFYDSLVVAAVLDTHCTILFSEDMQHKQWINGQLQICNPFVGF
jgi:predicted nucleic acid-binding protein